MSELQHRAYKLLAHLEASKVLLVEWEVSLQIRLGYPHAISKVSYFTWPVTLTHLTVSSTWFS